MVAECAACTLDVSCFINGTSSLFSPLRYDIDSGVQALEDSDGLQDLQAFMRRNRTKAVIYPPFTMLFIAKGRRKLDCMLLQATFPSKQPSRQ